MEPNFHFTKRLQTVSDRSVDQLRDLFLTLADDFDAETMGDALLFPREMTWFYGEPIWHELSPDKKLMLNRLSFCQSYYSTAVAEVATNVLNLEAALHTIIDADPQVALYMAREVTEEIFHIQAFLTIIRKVLATYGLQLEDLHRSNPSLTMSRHFVNMHTIAGWLRGDLNFYYFSRFALNVNQKTVERCTINEPDMHPHIRTILKNHAIDEARHMQMSRATGILAVARMRNPLAKAAACLAYAHFAARIFIGRSYRMGRLPSETRIRTLELCGVPAERARDCLRQWQSRSNQPDDPPLVRAGRAYYVQCNNDFIDDLDAPAWVKRQMKRILLTGYREANNDSGRVRPLEFEDLANHEQG